MFNGAVTWSMKGPVTTSVSLKWKSCMTSVFHSRLVSSHGEYGKPADESGDGLGLWVRTLTLQLGAQGRGGGLLPIQYTLSVVAAKTVPQIYCHTGRGASWLPPNGHTVFLPNGFIFHWFLRHRQRCQPSLKDHSVFLPDWYHFRMVINLSGTWVVCVENWILMFCQPHSKVKMRSVHRRWQSDSKLVHMTLFASLKLIMQFFCLLRRSPLLRTVNSEGVFCSPNCEE